MTLAEHIAAVKAALEAGPTEGPWHSTEDHIFTIVPTCCGNTRYNSFDEPPECCGNPEPERSGIGQACGADAAYITAACNAAPALISRIEELEKRCECLESEMQMDEEEAIELETDLYNTGRRIEQLERDIQLMLKSNEELTSVVKRAIKQEPTP